MGYSPWGRKESNTTTEPPTDRLVATTNNVVLVSGVQESDAAFQILFHHRLLQDIEYIYTRYRIYRIYPYAYSRFVLLIYFIYSSLAK